MENRNVRIIGLMSGTSADGIDACLAEIEERAGRLSARCAAFITVPYPPDTRRRVLNARTVEDACRLNFEVGERFAEAALLLLKEARVRPNKVDAIGSHGQTIYHVASGPERSTLQVGEPCVIAQRTGLTTVADFRPRDIAAGGTGAPLVPMVDFMLLSDPKQARVALNIGGIANITILPAGCAVNEVVAFDTGPGNMVIDGLMAALTGKEGAYDKGGVAAARGTVCDELLGELLSDGYYAEPPPKSTGREKFGAEFVASVLRRGRERRLPDDDIVATATALTARTVADATARWAGPAANEIVAAGGGVRNRTLMRMLREALPHTIVRRTSEFGIPVDAKEALAFAVLAWLTLNARPGNVLGATGASEPVVLGKIIPGRNMGKVRLKW